MKTPRPQKNPNLTTYSQQLLKDVAQLPLIWTALQTSWRKASLEEMRHIITPLTQLADNLKLIKKADDLETYAQILDLNLLQLQQQTQTPSYIERGNIQEQIDDLLISVKQFCSYLENPFHDIAGRAHKTICIVSADEILQQSLGQLLKKSGYAVQILPSIKALLQAMRLFSPLALLVDMRLKQQDLNVTRVMYTLQKSRRQNLPVLFLAHKNTFKARLAAIRAGCVGFFTQPVDQLGLLNSLSKLQFNTSAKHYQILLLDDKGDYYQKYAEVLNIAPLQLHYNHNTTVLPDLAQIDLLIIRMELKDITGLELSKIIRQHRAYIHLPIIILTRELEQNLSRTAMQGIADDVVRDKISPKRFANLVRNRIEHSRQRQQIFSEYAQKDQSTGVYNKDYLLEYLRNYKTTANAELPLSIWMIDLSQSYGDKNLDPLQLENQIRANAARLLQQYSHQQDQIAVWDNQRLVLLSEQYSSLNIYAAAQNLANRLQDKTQDSDRSYGLKSCAIGIAIHQTHQGKAWQTLWQAKQACDELLKNPKNGVQVLLDESHKGAEYQEISSPKRQAFIVEQLQQALGHHQTQAPYLQLHYQPMVHVHGKQISYYDSLLRLYHQDSDSIPTQEFLQVALQKGLSAQIDHWVIKQALNDLLAKYQQQQAVRFFVKLDDAVLEDPHFIDWLQGCLQNLDFPHDALIFDINAYHAIANPYIRSFVLGIKSLGCGLSLRNFMYETNHLELLEQLSLDFIKLHPSLTENLSADSDAFAQIQTIVVIAQNRGCEVIAIRLEHADKLSLLWQAQIDYVAGNFVQAPDKHLDFNFAA